VPRRSAADRNSPVDIIDIAPCASRLSSLRDFVAITADFIDHWQYRERSENAVSIAMKLDIAVVFAQLPQFLTQSEFVSIDYERGGALPRGTIHIDGKSCAAAISLWANGHCDVAFLSFNTDQKHTEHHEFDSPATAIETITQALKTALEYA
jgi:hypothetical protein